MPSKTARQRRFMGAELARKRAGKKTKTGMNESQLKEFSQMPHKKKKMESNGSMGKNQPMGDIGVKRQNESSKLGGFKEGPTVTTAGKFGGKA